MSCSVASFRISRIFFDKEGGWVGCRIEQVQAVMTDSTRSHGEDMGTAASAEELLPSGAGMAAHWQVGERP